MESNDHTDDPVLSIHGLIACAPGSVETLKAIKRPLEMPC